MQTIKHRLSVHDEELLALLLEKPFVIRSIQSRLDFKSFPDPHLDKAKARSLLILLRILSKMTESQDYTKAFQLQWSEVSLQHSFTLGLMNIGRNIRCSLNSCRDTRLFLTLAQECLQKQLPELSSSL